LDSSERQAKLRRTFDTNFDAVNRYCLRRVAVDDVNGVVSEVFVVAWRKIDQMPEGDDSLPWLYRVAHHQISNRRRSTRRRAALRDRIGGQANHPDPGPEPVIVRSDELRQIMAALSTLRPADQEILLLRTHEELDYSQLSVALGCSPDAARKRLTRAIRRLRRAANVAEAQSATPAFRAIEEGGD
jgi:RNA polymerase sigma-70 factor (ECF subfamily)